MERLKAALQDCDAVVIGAGAGLSTAAGFTYTGERFEKYFSDFAAKYGIQDMYSGGFFPFATPEEHWAYWSRYIFINRYQDAPKPVYNDLLKLVQDKDYFVITTNVDHCFQKADFDKKRLFYTQGDYGLFQCSEPCCQETFENEALIREMVTRQKNMKIPTELLPVCPHCGKEFIPTSNRQVFCSKECRYQAEQAEKKAKREAERGDHYYRQRKCAVCGKLFWPNSSGQTVCSEECRKKHHNEYSLEWWHKKQAEKELREVV